MTKSAVAVEPPANYKPERPSVSVIVACFNQRRFLGECLESLLAQTYPSVEIIVVDDGSTDGSQDLALTFGDKLRLITQANSGPAAARNRGIRAAKGAVIAFCDADDTLQPDCLERRTALLTEQPSAGMVTGSVNYMDESGARLDIPVDEIDSPRPVPLDTAITRNWGATCGTVVRKEALERCGLFDPMFRTCEDWELQVRIATHYRLWFDPTPLANARQVAGSLSRDPVQLYDDARRLLRKNRVYYPNPWRFWLLGHRALFLQVVGFTFFRVRREFGAGARKEVWRIIRLRPSVAIYLGAWFVRFLFNRTKRVFQSVGRSRVRAEGPEL